MKKVIRAWKESGTGGATKTYRCQEINLSWCICADIKKLFVRLSIYHGCINQRKDSGKYFWPLYRLPWFGQQHNRVTLQCSILFKMFLFVQQSTNLRKKSLRSVIPLLNFGVILHIFTLFSTALHSGSHKKRSFYGQDELGGSTPSVLTRSKRTLPVRLTKKGHFFYDCP